MRTASAANASPSPIARSGRSSASTPVRRVYATSSDASRTSCARPLGRARHLQGPAGAVRKDGPSPGITMATAIASLVRQQPVSDDVGMTGEITLTGQVLPIGGIREKSLAAQRAGLKRVIMPRENEPDLAELPAETKRELEFILVDSIDEVFEAAFDGRGATRSKPVPVKEKHAARPAEPVARAGFEPSSGVGRA